MTNEEYENEMHENARWCDYTEDEIEELIWG